MTMTRKLIKSADQLVNGKEYILAKRLRKVTAHFDEVVSEKAKPGEWTPKKLHMPRFRAYCWDVNLFSKKIGRNYLIGYTGTR